MGDLKPGEDPSILVKIAAGVTTGALGITVANPTDLVKVRMQAEGKLPEGVPKKYPSAVSAYGIIAKEEGLLGLWRGLGPNIGRNSVVNAAELASYDQIKQTLMKVFGMPDTAVTHSASALCAGLLAVAVGSPVDVVKSRMMGSSEYTGMFDCFAKTFKNDGPLGFYKGFLPNYARLGSWNVIMFLTLEQIKQAIA